jgi:hypothetical protein
MTQSLARRGFALMSVESLRLASEGAARRRFSVTAALVGLVVLPALTSLGIGPVCGGVMLADALDMLIAELKRVETVIASEAKQSRPQSQ